MIQEAYEELAHKIERFPHELGNRKDERGLLARLWSKVKESVIISFDHCSFADSPFAIDGAQRHFRYRHSSLYTARVR